MEDTREIRGLPLQVHSTWLNLPYNHDDPLFTKPSPLNQNIKILAQMPNVYD